MKDEGDGAALLRRWRAVARKLLVADRVAFVFLLRAAELATEDCAADPIVTTEANIF